MCTLALSLPHDFDAAFISAGDVLCHREYPIKVVRQFRAQIQVIDVPTPITKGFKAAVHSHFVKNDGHIAKLVRTIDPSSSETISKFPKLLKKGDMAEVNIKLEQRACLELYKNFRTFGRIVLRDGVQTVAAGIITEFLK